MTKLYDGPDGKKYVEDGVRMWVNSITGAVCGPSFTTNGTERIILRLATPEEIAGSEKKMCPAGCGFEYGSRAHSANLGTCPWSKAYAKSPAWTFEVSDEANDRASCEYADAHWKEFVKYEVGVDLGKEPSKSAGVLLTPESVGKAYRTRAGWKVVLGWHQDGSALDYYARTLDGLSTYHAYFSDGKSCTSNKNFDLISEWDEKAEAGSSLGAVSKPSDDRSEVREAAPAQPEILPTWTDGDVRAELAARTGVVHVDAAENRRRLVAVMAEDARPREVYRPDAPDRRTEHVPVAKDWVNPAMLGR